MRKRIFTLALLALLCVGLATPVLAAGDTPEISITWINSKVGSPISYNRDFNWLTLGNAVSDSCVIDAKTGKKIEDYDLVCPFSDGLAQVMKRDADGNPKYGFISKTGAVVVPLEYDAVSDFSEGLAVVGQGTYPKKYGYIDTTGSIVIPIEYYMAGSFSEGLARVEKTESGNFEYINAKGSVVLRPETDFLANSFSDGLALILTQKNGSYYIDRGGSVAISAKEYSRVMDFSEGLAAVRKGDDETGKWGFIDTMGTLVIPCQYRLANECTFNDGLAVVFEKDGIAKFGCIDKTGSLVLPTEYSQVRHLGDGLWFVWGNTGTNRGHGYFVSPYSDWQDADLDTLLKGVKSIGAFPIVPVVGGGIAVVAVGAVAAVLVLKRKKPAVEIANVSPTQKVEPPKPTTPLERPQATPTVKETPPASGPKFCPNCGKPLTPGVKFCPECGQPLQSKEG